MPVEVSWDDQCHQCIRVAIGGGWIWDDLYTALKLADSLSEDSEHERIDYIFDVRQGNIFPRDVLHKIRRVRLQLHQKARLIIVVGQGTFAGALIQVLESIASPDTRIEQVKSLDEAYELVDDSE